MSKFLLVIPNCLPVTQKFVTEHLEKIADWWHWSPDVWLLRFNAEMTAEDLRDRMTQMLPNVQVLVMKFESSHWQWAGFGPQEWTSWFRTSWEKRT